MHPDLHVLEPGKAESKCVLTVGRTGPSPFRVLDQDLQAKSSLAPLRDCGCLSPTLPWPVTGWEIPGPGGMAGDLQTRQPPASPKRTGAGLPRLLFFPGPGLKEEAKKHRVGAGPIG